ncbi:hypothetical protein B0A52_00510 [Exophiala mesophila]|uniref:Major facilitator superfamily (MFS) profile domain-containing protein n=1 Tax=Exophiala mesophila TaxID=212818 RepID=A0A438NKB0_EXOME|nr:hypothetical protein B0A52_00510 [Exophiala mesophila]
MAARDDSSTTSTRVEQPSPEKQGETFQENAQNAETVEDIDPALSKRLDRKFDRHIIFWLFGIWLFAFIDRSNIGNARIDGLVEDLNLHGTRFNIALVVFYVPYILVDVPSNWVVKYFKAGNYLPALIILWGLVSTFLGFTKSYGGLIAARFFLGLFEGGLLGGMIVYLAMFYERHQMLFRIGLFYCAAPLSGAFGGLLASGLAQIKHGGYNRWPWIFFIEGAITVCFGLLALCFMPHTPAQCKFLTDDERLLAVKRMRLDASGAATEQDVDHEKFDWHWSFSLFLPTIISALGYSSTTAQLFTVPPNMAAFLLVLITAGLSDKLKARGPFMIVGCVLAIVGYVMLLAAERPSVRYGGTFFVACGVFPCSPMVMGWLSNNTAPHFVRATATGFEIAFANCAAFIATFTYLSKDAILTSANPLHIRHDLVTTSRGPDGGGGYGGDGYGGGGGYGGGYGGESSCQGSIITVTEKITTDPTFGPTASTVTVPGPIVTSIGSFGTGTSPATVVSTITVPGWTSTSILTSTVVLTRTVAGATTTVTGAGTSASQVDATSTVVGTGSTCVSVITSTDQGRTNTVTVPGPPGPTSTSTITIEKTSTLVSTTLAWTTATVTGTSVLVKTESSCTATSTATVTTTSTTLAILRSTVTVTAVRTTAVPSTTLTVVSTATRIVNVPETTQTVSRTLTATVTATTTLISSILGSTETRTVTSTSVWTSTLPRVTETAYQTNVSTVTKTVPTTTETSVSTVIQTTTLSSTVITSIITVTQTSQQPAVSTQTITQTLATGCTSWTSSLVTPSTGSTSSTAITTSTITVTTTVTVPHTSPPGWRDWQGKPTSV